MTPWLEVQGQGANMAGSGEGPIPALQTAAFLPCPYMAFLPGVCTGTKEGDRDTAL